VEPAALATQLIDAINRRDTEAALATMHADIVLTPLLVRTGIAARPFQGHAAVRRYLEQIPVLWADSRMNLLAVHQADTRFVAFCDAQLADDRRLAITYLGRAKDGLVLELAAFADLDEARRLLGAPAAGPELPPIELQLPAVASSVPAARRVLAAFLTAHNVDASLYPRVALAATEAVTNVVVHAYRHVDEPGELTLRGEITGAQLLVSVGDHGCGLRPRVDSPGLGLGITVMSQQAAELAFVVAPERPEGTEVRLRFDLE
jgi:anti-sigma regulatory factor (Ser/Thr protein kinase)/ketosteroid isomerase-like protein